MRKQPERRQVEFRHGIDSYVEAFERLRRAEPTRHTSIVDIVRLDADSTLPERPIDEQLRTLGYDQLRLYDWDAGEDNEGYGLPSLKNAGATIFLKDNIGRMRSLITVKDVNVPADVPDRDEEIAVYNIVLLFHEVGHVDDAEKRLNIVCGKAGKPKEAELYAHHYACMRMMKETFAYPVAIYLDRVIEFALKQGVKPYRDAANEFKCSGQYKMYRKFASQFFTPEHRHCPPP